MDINNYKNPFASSTKEIGIEDIPVDDSTLMVSELRQYVRQMILESIKLDIKIGDIILTGRYKNKRTVVKSIGEDEYGHPTINGKPILKFKIEKELPKSKWSAKSREELEESVVNNKLSLKDLLFERTVPGNLYPNNFSGFLEMVMQHQNDIWIFFDTETTGLYYKENHVQATEVAAVAYNNNGFTAKPSLVENGTFHMKIALQPDTVSYMEQEPDEYENPSNKTIKQLLVMTQYDEGSVEKSTPEEVAIDFTKYLDRMKTLANSQGGQVRLIAQNAVFDIGIMNELYSRAGIPLPDDMVWDTKAVFQRHFKEILEFLENKSKFPLSDNDKKIIDSLKKEGEWGPYLSSSLGDLVNAFNIGGGDNWHTAIADVQLTMEVLYSVVQYLKLKGSFIQNKKSKPFNPEAGDPYYRSLRNK